MATTFSWQIIAMGFDCMDIDRTIQVVRSVTCHLPAADLAVVWKQNKSPEPKRLVQNKRISAFFVRRMTHVCAFHHVIGASRRQRVILNKHWIRGKCLILRKLSSVHTSVFSHCTVTNTWCMLKLKSSQVFPTAATSTPCTSIPRYIIFSLFVHTCTAKSAISKMK